MKQAIGSFIVGIIFALGLGVARLTDPQKILNFLNLTRTWDPSLLFVMAGAIGVHFTLMRLILRRRAPLLDREFHFPTRTKIDYKLIVGAAVFGIGWGLAGYCPGPAITSLAAFSPSSLIFVVSMALGMYIHKWFTSAAHRRT